MQVNRNPGQHTIEIALAGNPNAGKSTIFNMLTGANQHVGNWPGKTIERREGSFTHRDQLFTIIDLPGTYSLSAFTTEEIIAMDVLLSGEQDAFVAVVDAGNLERNLYFTLQLLETGIPVVIVLNMMDAAQARGLDIDTEKLSSRLGNAPVIPTIARRGEGIEALKDILHRIHTTPDSHAPSVVFAYSDGLEEHIAKLSAAITAVPALANRGNERWLSIKLVENDPYVLDMLQDVPGTGDLLKLAADCVEQVQASFGDDPDVILADQRYSTINRIVGDVLTRPGRNARTLSDRADSVLTHPIWGLPFFVAVMWVVFQMTANVSAYYVDWIDVVLSGPVTRWVTAFMNMIALGDTWIASLLVDGVVAGVGGVLVFIPVLAFMYFFIAILEDTGYMARAAFLMDRFMSMLGLHGKSFIPMLLGFGCSVPGVYATRALENKRDRILTGMLVPFMSCGARLPVYLVIGAAFFGRQVGTLVFALYMAGIVVAILVGLALRKTLFRTDDSIPFIIELPPYRVPAFKGLFKLTWERTRGFIENATTIILAASVIVWLMLAIPVNAPDKTEFASVDADHSALAAVSKAAAPAFRPAGFDTWQSTSSLVTGFVAKEVIVSTLSVVYAGGEDVEENREDTTFGEDLLEIGSTFITASWDTLRATVSLIPGINLMGDGADESSSAALESALKAAFTPLSAVAFCVFVLLMAPCVTAMTAWKQEFGLRWTTFGVAMMMAVAWVASVAVYQGGMLMGMS